MARERVPLALPESGRLDETFADARANSWYSTGVKLDGPATAQEALALAGLDYDVELRPATFRTSEGKFRQIPDRFAVVRADTDEALGVVGRNYKVWQNRAAFAIADGLVESGFVLDAAGAYRGGRRIFLAARLDDETLVLDDDPYRLYLFLTTSHDGTRAMTASIVPVRLRSTSLVAVAMRGARMKWTIRHTSTAEARRVKGREALQLTFKAANHFDHVMSRLASRPLSELELAAAVENVLPKSRGRERKLSQVLAVYRTSSAVEAYRSTRYGGLQAFCEWLDWGRPVRNDATRFEVSFDAYGARWRQAFYEAIVG